MNGIDYSAFFAAQQPKLTAAQQNMALMTSLFQNVAVPLMQMHMQGKQLDLEQQRFTMGLELQKDKLAFEQKRAGEDFQLRREEIKAADAREEKRFQNNLETERFRAATAADMLDVTNAYEIQKLWMQKDADREILKYKFELDTHQTEEQKEVAKAQLLSAKLDSLGRASALLTVGMESGDPTAIEIGLDAVAAAKEAVSGIGGTAAKTVSSLTTSTSVTSIAGMLKDPVQKDDLYNNPAKAAFVLSGITNAPTSQFASAGISSQTLSSTIADLSTTRVGFENMQWLRKSPDGEWVDKHDPVAGSDPKTYTNPLILDVVRLRREDPARYNEWKESALKKAKPHEKTEMSNFFKAAEGINFSRLPKENAPSTSAKSDAPPEAIEDAKSLYGWRWAGNKAGKFTLGVASGADLAGRTVFQGWTKAKEGAERDLKRAYNTYGLDAAQ